MTQPSRQVIRFSTFELALDTGELRKAGIRIALQEHSRRVLLRLLERPGALVTREELRASLWPSDTFVDFEHGLNTAIKRLRDALGDSAGTPRFIETLPRRGYRFIAAIEPDPQTASAIEQHATSRTSRVRWIPIAVGVALLVSTVVMILTLVPVRPPTPSDAAMTHLSVLVTPAEQLLTSDALELPISYGRPTRTAIALSPDGRLLAFSGRRGDQLHLYLRPLDKGDAIEVKGTDGAGSPFFSPDGAWIGFWSGGKIKKVRVDGGPVMDVCATSPTGDPKASRDLSISGEIVGASWGSDDTIVFALQLGGLWQVAAGGGVPTSLTTLRADEMSHRLPHVLPGRHGVLFTVIRTVFNWHRVSTDVLMTATGERKELVPQAVDARYLESGHLVYARDGVLFAQRFDAARVEVSGSPLGVLDNVMHAIGAGGSNRDTGAAQVAISRTGTLAYARGGPYPAIKRRLVWVDAQGRESPVGAPPRPYLAPRLSPDGKRIAFMVRTSQESDVWVDEPPDGASAPMTFGGLNAFPIWTPDGSRLTISRSMDGPTNLFWIPLTGGTHEPEILASTAEQSRTPADWTPDGNTLVFAQDVLDKPYDIWTLTREQATWRATPLVRSPFSDIEPALSPDGRWLAYASDETGHPQVYVQPFPGPGMRHQISVNGGREPLWARDGRTLYYLEPNLTPPGGHTVTAVSVTSGPRLTPGKPKPLFTTRYAGTTPVRGYDIAKDGRFLMPYSEPVPSGVVTHLDIIQNWSPDRVQTAPSSVRR